MDQPESSTRSTALVTGASAGLGGHFALALAARGHDVVITARRGDRLDQLADVIRTRHGVAAHAIRHDLGRPDGAQKLLAKLDKRGLSVDLLVNNAGFGALGAFADMDRAMLARMVDLNCRAVMELSHALLPHMMARGSGGIINIASTAAFQPGPWMAVYYASKAFVLHFSEALHEEARPHGVAVVALCPGPTTSEFADIAGMAQNPLFARFSGDPRRVVQDGLTALDANQAVRISGRRNAMLAFATRFAPRGLLRRTVAGLQSKRR